jgi:hypothetical protein
MNQILEGRHGSGKRAEALLVAKRLLGTDPESSPDFTLVEPDEKGLLSVELIKEVSEFCSYAGKKVIVITNLHKATEKFQQSLLKLLEDTPDADFIITAEGELLDTIYSRCMRRFVRPLPSEEARKMIEEKYGSVNEKAYRISGNSLSIYEKIVGEDKFLDRAVKVLELMKKPEDGRALMDALGVTPDGTKTFNDLFGVGATELLMQTMSRELIDRGEYAGAWWIEERGYIILKNFTKPAWCSFCKGLYQRL